ncbi:MAG: TrkH family potassium uptake protein [Bacteroidetes bacterium]|nr:TrkH family potassium uptake protein [Bacteroidota bacterium]
MKISMLAKAVGIMMMLESIALLACFIISLIIPDGGMDAFAFSSVSIFLVGFFLWLAYRRAKFASTARREGYLMAPVSLIVVILGGALPYLLSGTLTHFSDAFFESTSGFTTTGATVINDVECLPHSIVFWRSMTQWLGGLGILFLVTGIFPYINLAGMQLFSMEIPGVIKDRVHPHLAGVAKRLFALYFLFTILEVVVLMMMKIPWFESVCFSFSTISTGGFSPFNDSVMSLAPSVQWILIIFMLLAGMSFPLHYFVLKGKFIKIWEDEEFRYYFSLIFFISMVTAVVLWYAADKTLIVSIRDAVFQVVSIVSTTGFISLDVAFWPPFLWFMILLLLFVGGCSGSPSGGIKTLRHIILFNNARAEFRKLLHPNAVICVRYNDKPVTKEFIFNTLVFFLVYLMIFALGSLALSLFGMDFISSLTTAASTLGNVGPGFTKDIQNYLFISHPIPIKWVMVLLMIAGRLELFAFFIIFSPIFWRK